MPDQARPTNSLQRPTPLVQALEKSEAVKETVKQTAAQMLVVNTVLQQEIPVHAQIGEVAQALAHNDQIENVLHESADELAEVNLSLEREIDERRRLEGELAQAQIKLAQTRTLQRVG